MYFYMLPDWLKNKLLAISGQDMTFIVFSLLITAITFGITLLIMFLNCGLKDS